MIRVLPHTGAPVYSAGKNRKAEPPGPHCPQPLVNLSLKPRRTLEGGKYTILELHTWIQNWSLSPFPQLFSCLLNSSSKPLESKTRSQHSPEGGRITGFPWAAPLQPGQEAVEFARLKRPNPWGPVEVRTCLLNSYSRVLNPESALTHSPVKCEVSTSGVLLLSCRTWPAT